MESILKSDIFFFITTILTVLIAIFIIWALVYIIGIIKTAKKISERAKQLFNATSEDIDQFRTNIKEKGINWVSLVSRFIPKKKSVRKSSKPDTK